MLMMKSVQSIAVSDIGCASSRPRGLGLEGILVSISACHAAPKGLISGALTVGFD
jgi:hypothetical protein